MSLTQASAQSFSPSDFVYPIQGVERLYSANFGELRADHFHSGIDIKSDGVTGKRVVAAADGYISRISLSPYGYGLALYLAHPNGTTTVYGHLSKYCDAVAKYVEAERYRTKSHTVNLYCKPDQFVVKSGDLIGYSGNTGSSGGPHLHFEVRDGATQEPLNVVSHGIISPRDNIAPLIRQVHYIEVDTLQGVVRQADRRSFDVTKAGAAYSLAGGGKISAGRSGFFVLEVSDRRDDVTNTFGVHRITASIDKGVFYEYVMDRFSFSNTRYCNAIGYYPLMITSRNEVFRLAAVENCDMSHYTQLVNGGAITTQAGEVRDVNIEVADDMGNLSYLEFSIVGRADHECFVAQEVDSMLVVQAAKEYNYSGDSISVTIPAKSLYESIVFSCEEVESTDSTLLSKVYKVMDAATPLHSAMMISIDADVPFELQSKVGMVCVGRSGYPSFIGGEYRYGRITAKSRTAGEFYVKADLQAPTLKLGIDEGSQQGGSSYFSCAVSDDLSGVARYEATLDGEWIALSLDKGRLYHTFREKPTGVEHTLIIKATDGVGNTTSITRKFIR